ncbi:hypothetical protein F2Q68_00014821 [Brassica cretica]|uniref:Uncharacterized protein n=2 Tax=Brassica cretica TaxID=69181 RepID=A0A8S9HTE2_BRACR|nr:hypothetical protein F2Q68_00014821 [Brassica cretica]KAF3607141.1 hypothetical protein DY000_02047579 [Brassica cretica]
MQASILQGCVSACIKRLVLSTRETVFSIRQYNTMNLCSEIWLTLRSFTPNYRPDAPPPPFKCSCSGSGRP